MAAANKKQQQKVGTFSCKMNDPFITINLLEEHIQLQHAIIELLKKQQSSLKQEIETLKIPTQKPMGRMVIMKKCI